MSQAVQTCTYNRGLSKNQATVKAWASYRTAQFNGWANSVISDMKERAMSFGFEPDSVKSKWVYEYKRMGRIKPFDL